jgi:hypothetical protein
MALEASLDHALPAVLPDEGATWDRDSVDRQALEQLAALAPHRTVPAYWQLRTVVLGMRIAIADDDPYWANTARASLKGFIATVGIDAELAGRAHATGVPFRPNVRGDGPDIGSSWDVPRTTQQDT